MNKSRIVLALLFVICGASASAQYDDGGASGSICNAGEYCPPPVPGYNDGGHGSIDPSPYDPNPGRPNRPGRPPQQPRPGNPGRPGAPVNPGYPGSGHEVILNQYYRNQPLDLNRIFGLSAWNNRGQQVRSVTLMIQNPDAYANLDLIADGFVVASEPRPRYMVTLNPRKHLVYGQSLESLIVNIRGSVYVERVAIDLTPGNGGGYPPPGPIGDVVLPAYLNQSYYSPANLALAPMMNLRNYNGYRLSDVTVFGSSLQQATTARIMIDNRIVGTIQLRNRPGVQTVRLNGYVIGQNVRQLNLLIDGSAHIERVEARLQRY